MVTALSELLSSTIAPSSFSLSANTVLRASLLAGAGIGYMPDWTFADLQASGEVVVLMPEWQVPPIPIHLVSPAARKHSAKVRAFNEHIANAFRVESITRIETHQPSGVTRVHQHMENTALYAKMGQ